MSKHKNYVEELEISAKGIIDSNLEEDKKKEAIIKLKKYFDMILRWGFVHNIVSKKEPHSQIVENVLDSIFFSNFLYKKYLSKFPEGATVVDAGAGGGFPGLPLSILFSDEKFILVDIDRKKCSFLRLVKAALGLNNVEVSNKDICSLKDADLVVTKAAFPPSQIAKLVGTLKLGGTLIVWSSAEMRPQFVLALKKAGMTLTECLDYDLPTHKKRSLLFLEKG